MKLSAVCFVLMAVLAIGSARRSFYDDASSEDQYSPSPKFHLRAKPARREPHRVLALADSSEDDFSTSSSSEEEELPVLPRGGSRKNTLKRVEEPVSEEDADDTPASEESEESVEEMKPKFKFQINKPAGPGLKKESLKLTKQNKENPTIQSKKIESIPQKPRKISEEESSEDNAASLAEESDEKLKVKLIPIKPFVQQKVPTVKLVEKKTKSKASMPSKKTEEKTSEEDSSALSDESEEEQKPKIQLIPIVPQKEVEIPTIKLERKSEPEDSVEADETSEEESPEDTVEASEESSPLADEVEDKKIKVTFVPLPPLKTAQKIPTVQFLKKPEDNDSESVEDSDETPLSSEEEEEKIEAPVVKVKAVKFQPKNVTPLSRSHKSQSKKHTEVEALIEEIPASEESKEEGPIVTFRKIDPPKVITPANRRSGKVNPEARKKVEAAQAMKNNSKNTPAKAGTIKAVKPPTIRKPNKLTLKPKSEEKSSEEDSNESS